MTTTAVKITRKGQITLPKEIREKLKTDTVYFEVRGNDVVVRPVPDAAGALRDYAKNAPLGMKAIQMKEKAWEEAVREKTRAEPS